MWIYRPLIQRDNATLFQSLCLWEKLLDHCGSQQRTTNAHQVVATRFQMMITEPYVALAFFAPVTVKTFENVTIVENALEQYLSSIAAGCHDEFIRFKASAHRPSAGAVTLDSYRSYISNRIRPQYPTIATVLINLLAACPTEAAVERGFSFLKFIANDWRNRLEEETVEALLVLPSCHKMLKGISLDAVSFRVPFRFRVNYVSENTSAHNAHQPPTDNTRTDADLLRARSFTGIMDKEMQRGKEREGKTHRTLNASALATPTCT
jgi:hypothetical protein